MSPSDSNVVLVLMPRPAPSGYRPPPPGSQAGTFRLPGVWRVRRAPRRPRGSGIARRDSSFGGGADFVSSRCVSWHNCATLLLYGPVQRTRRPHPFSGPGVWGGPGGGAGRLGGTRTGPCRGGRGSGATSPGTAGSRRCTSCRPPPRSAGRGAGPSRSGRGPRTSVPPRRQWCRCEWSRAG